MSEKQHTCVCGCGKIVDNKTTIFPGHEHIMSIRGVARAQGIAPEDFPSSDMLKFLRGALDQPNNKAVLKLLKEA